MEEYSSSDKGYAEEEEACLKIPKVSSTPPKGNTSLKQEALLYGIEDIPSPVITFFIGLQQVAMSISGSIAIPLIVADLICMAPNATSRAHVVCTFVFMCGVSTVLQCVIGVRLPLIQGGCGKFIPPIATLMALEKFRCLSAGGPDEKNGMFNLTESGIYGMDGHNLTYNITGMEDESWMYRMRELQGGILLASLTEFLLASSGIMGLFLRFITPITIMPTITLQGLSLFQLAANLCQVHWGISSLTIVLILIFSLYLNNISIPLPSFNFKKRCHITRLFLFKLFPVVLAVAVSWTLTCVLTVTGTFPDDPQDKSYQARSDANIATLQRMPWFYMPYPGQWGVPTFSAASYLGMLAATLGSVVESIGDYYACARACAIPQPPVHAMNRGIAIEGFGGMLSGIFGSGGSTTSYSQNVGAIGFTKAGSRRAFQVAGLILMFCGVFGKFGAMMTMLPKPILGAILVVGLGMVTAVGISNLQFVNMASSRNQCIVGLSLMLGMVIPAWSTQNPDAINTGNAELDQSFKVLLQTSMFVGGVIAFILDNTVPGTPEDRGLIKWNGSPGTDEALHTNSKSPQLKPPCRSYDLPLITPWLKTQRWARFIPILPSFDENIFRFSCKCLRCFK